METDKRGGITLLPEWQAGYKAGQRDEHQQHSWDGSELDRLAHEESLKRQGRKELLERIQSLNPNYPDIHIGIAFTPWEAMLREEGIA